MKVYKYNEEKIFERELEAHLDPLETKIQGKNVYLLPANSTFDKPRTIKGKVAVFVKNKWDYYDDNRGKYYYENGIKQIKDIKDKHIPLTDEELNKIYQGMTCKVKDGKYEFYFTDEFLIEKISNQANSYLSKYDFYFNRDYPEDKVPARLEEYRMYLRGLNSEHNLKGKDLNEIKVLTFEEFILE